MPIFPKIEGVIVAQPCRLREVFQSNRFFFTESRPHHSSPKGQVSDCCWGSSLSVSLSLSLSSFHWNQPTKGALFVCARSRVMWHACAFVGFSDWCLIVNFKWKCRAFSLRRSTPRKEFSWAVKHLGSTAWTSCLGDHRLDCRSWSWEWWCCWPLAPQFCHRGDIWADDGLLTFCDGHVVMQGISFSPAWPQARRRERNRKDRWSQPKMLGCGGFKTNSHEMRRQSSFSIVVPMFCAASSSGETVMLNNFSFKRLCRCASVNYSCMHRVTFPTDVVFGGSLLHLFPACVFSCVCGICHDGFSVVTVPGNTAWTKTVPNLFSCLF